MRRKLVGRREDVLLAAQRQVTLAAVENATADRRILALHPDLRQAVLRAPLRQRAAAQVARALGERADCADRCHQRDGDDRQGNQDLHQREARARRLARRAVAQGRMTSKVPEPIGGNLRNHVARAAGARHKAPRPDRGRTRGSGHRRRGAPGTSVCMSQCLRAQVGVVVDHAPLRIPEDDELVVVAVALETDRRPRTCASSRASARSCASRSASVSRARAGLGAPVSATIETMTAAITIATSSSISVNPRGASALHRGPCAPFSRASSGR